MTTEPTGLRALKKRQTRERISDCATRLFLARGFDDVTIAEIAAAAEVSKMTVTNYFPRKEDIALDLHDQFVQRLANTVTERSPGESALEALRRDFLAAAADHDPVIGFSGADFAQMVVDSRALVARLRDFHDDRERALLAALADDPDAADNAAMPRVAAALLGAVHRMLFEETLRRTLAGEDDETIAKAVSQEVDFAFGTLEPALGDYGRRTASRG